MDNHLIGGQRGMPLHPAAPQDGAAQNTAQTKGLQQDAVASVDVQVHAPAPSEDFTISVDQVRDHFRARGLIKSKDTVQRWCRNGDLSCQKRGVLGRYFTTEQSLKTLEAKLLPDMIAENSGASAPASTGTQLHAGVERSSLQERAAAQGSDTNDLQLHEAVSAGARSDTPELVQAHAAAHTGVPLSSAAKVAELQAQVDGLTSQLEQAQSTNEFLKGEIVSARGQRGDVVKIAEQMLGTLETIAVGGRLERPSTQPQDVEPDPVRYQQVKPDAGGV